MKRIFCIAIFVFFTVSINALYAQKVKWTKEIYEYGNLGTILEEGTITYKNGDVFTGEMAQDNEKLKGTYTYTDASGIKYKYTGTFNLDKKDGFGELWWDGNYYAGYFSMDKMYGYGTLVMKDGTTKSGYFVDGEFYAGYISDKNGNLIEFKKWE
jgi:hypothetical protein